MRRRSLPICNRLLPKSNVRHAITIKKRIMPIPTQTGGFRSSGKRLHKQPTAISVTTTAKPMTMNPNENEAVLGIDSYSSCDVCGVSSDMRDLRLHPQQI